MMKLSKKALELVTLSVISLVGILGSIALIYHGWLRWHGGTELRQDSYQAVFLSNEQVYFGHLTRENARYPVLRDVYYVKLEGSTQGAAILSTSTGHLVKLGESEPHGPRNEMVINKDHILFWENLRPDSAVVRLIEQMKTR